MEISKEDQDKIEKRIEDELNRPLCCCCKQNLATRKDYRDNNGCLGSCPVCEECFYLNDKAFRKLKNRTEYPKQIIAGKPWIKDGVCINNGRFICDFHIACDACSYNKEGAVKSLKAYSFICAWCKIRREEKDLYSWTGYEALCGPICRECVVIRQPCYNGMSFCRKFCKGDGVCPATCTGDWERKFPGLMRHLKKKNILYKSVKALFEKPNKEGDMDELKKKVLDFTRKCRDEAISAYQELMSLVKTKGKYSERLHEEIEVEEVHREDEIKAETVEAEYNERKHRYTKMIIGNLECFVKRPSEEWRLNEEEFELIDILSLVENTIKARLSANYSKHKG